MIKKSFMYLLTTMMVATLSMGFVSCKKDDPDDDEVSVGMSSVNLSESGGSQTIQIMSNTKWTISGAQGWLTVSPMQGSGNGSITITANANTDNNSRNCTLYVNAGDAMTQINVYQSGKTKQDPGTEVAADYVGTLKPIEYSDDPQRCYITLTRLSKDAVRMTRLICQAFNIDISTQINLSVEEKSDGTYYLQSEAGRYIIEGTYYQGLLTLSVIIGGDSFYFSGTKD